MTIEFEVFCGLTNSLLAAKKPDELVSYFHSKFKASKSSTYTKNGKSCSVHYGSASISGHFSQDNIGIGDVVVKDQLPYRNYGDILCDECTQGRTVLFADGNVQPVRVCDNCMEDYWPYGRKMMVSQGWAKS